MQTQGVIQFRLVGDHPAASGRARSIGFAGETVTVAKLLRSIIEQNQINLSRYKLEVRQYVSQVSSGTTSTDPGSLAEGSANSSLNESVLLALDDTLRTYDRLSINISRRQLSDQDPIVQPSGRSRSNFSSTSVTGTSSDLLGPAQTGGRATNAADMEFLLMQCIGAGAGAEAVSGSLIASGASSSLQGSNTMVGASGLRQTAVADALQLQRLAVIANHTSLPLHPRLSLNSRPVQRCTTVASSRGPNTVQSLNQYVCLLCNLPSFSPVYLMCCVYVVCSSCTEYASAMVDEGTCPVCGQALQVGTGDDALESFLKREAELQRSFAALGAAERLSAPEESVDRTAGAARTATVDSSPANSRSTIDVRGDRVGSRGVAPNALADPQSGFQPARHRPSMEPQGADQFSNEVHQSERTGSRSPMRVSRTVKTGDAGACGNAAGEPGSGGWGAEVTQRAAPPLVPPMKPSESAAMIQRALEALSKNALVENPHDGTLTSRILREALTTPPRAQQEWAAAKRKRVDDR